MPPLAYSKDSSLASSIDMKLSTGGRGDGSGRLAAIDVVVVVMESGIVIEESLKAWDGE
jgi:hypothetical protein